MKTYVILTYERFPHPILFFDSMNNKSALKYLETMEWKKFIPENMPSDMFYTLEETKQVKVFR